MEHDHTKHFTNRSRSVQIICFRVINIKYIVHNNGYLLQKRRILNRFVCFIQISHISAKVLNRLFFSQQTYFHPKIAYLHIHFSLFSYSWFHFTKIVFATIILWGRPQFFPWHLRHCLWRSHKRLQRSFRQIKRRSSHCWLSKTICRRLYR